MSMWFWMNKVVKVKIDQGTFFVWILNSFILIIMMWLRLSQMVRVFENKGERKGDMEFFRKRVGGVVYLVVEKPQTMFCYNTNF
jgi:hypothetical protein